MSNIIVNEWLSSPQQLGIERKHIHIWKAPLDRIITGAYSLHKILSPDELQRANNYRFIKDQLNFIKTRYTLRNIFNRYLSINPIDIRFEYNRYGKPSLARTHNLPNIKFNLSHSANYALFIFALDFDVGIDIEQIRPFDNIFDFSKRFFTANETAAIMAATLSERQELFYKCWTRKEAFIKAQGYGLSLPLQEFSVSLTPGHCQLLEACNSPELTANWSLYAIEDIDNYAAAYASASQSNLVKLFDFI